jgi:hypothetical protein
MFPFIVYLYAPDGNLVKQSRHLDERSAMRKVRRHFPQGGKALVHNLATNRFYTVV